MKFIFVGKDGYSHGSSGKSHGKAVPVSEWGGNWGDYFLRKKFPRTYWLRKFFIKK